MERLSPSVRATGRLIGVPAAMVVGELCVRYDRPRLSWPSLNSTAFAAAIGPTTDAAYELTLVVCMIFGCRLTVEARRSMRAPSRPQHPARR